MSDPYEPRYSAPPKKSGSGKWWLLGCGCVGLILGCFGCCGIVPYFYFEWIKGSQAYKDSVAKVRAHPEVKQEIGEPMEPSFWAGGAVDETQGTAVVVYQLKGPNGEAVVAGEASKAAGEKEWKFRKLDVQVQKPGGAPKTIDVIKKEKDTESDAKDKGTGKVKEKDKPKANEKK